MLTTTAAGALPALFCVLLFLSSCTAYYIPGTYPKEFVNGDNLAGALFLCFAALQPKHAGPRDG